MIKMIPSSEPNKYQLEQIKRKFGMFIHFGINTFGNVEWSDGTLPVDLYNPTSIDADSWVRTAYEAGMNYVLAITKHHDGFCMFDTDTTDYGVRNSPNKTDVIMEISKACKKYGVKFAVYYSLWDRHEPSYVNDWPKYIDYMCSHLEILLGGKYGEVVELWFDGSWDKPCKDWQFERLYDFTKRLQPQCQIGINHTIGEYSEEKTGPDESRYLPTMYQENDPIRMFPSDFRLWDPHMCRVDDPKIYTFEGEHYYMPFEMTICSRKEFSWFYSNIYEEKELYGKDDIVKCYRELVNCDNLMVVNMPPNTNGKLVESDVVQLMEVADELGIRRQWK